MQLSMTAYYQEQGDYVEVTIIKHDGSTDYPVSSAFVELRQDTVPIQSVTLSSPKTTENIVFLHPKMINNLRVFAEVDTLTLLVDVIYVRSRTDDREQPREEEFPDPTDTTDQILPPIILDVNFNEQYPVVKNHKDSLLEFSGGGRYLFSNLGRLVLQPVDTYVKNAPVFIEKSANQLLNTTVGLNQIFNLEYDNGAVNQHVTKREFEIVDTLILKVLGSVSSEPVDKFSFALKDPITMPGSSATFSMLLCLTTTQPLNVETFKLIVTREDPVGTVVETATVIANVSDYLNQIRLINAGVVGGGGVLNAKVEFEGLNNGDVFDVFVTLPQVTDLPFVTSSISSSIRPADVWSIDSAIDFRASTIEVSLEAGNNEDCYIFDLGTIRGYYSSGDLVFEVNGTLVSYTVDLTSASIIAFIFDTVADELRIDVNGSTVVTGGAGFVIDENISHLFIGCGKDGLNQLNGQFNRIRIFR